MVEPDIFEELIVQLRASHVEQCKLLTAEVTRLQEQLSLDQTTIHRSEASLTSADSGDLESWAFPKAVEARAPSESFQVAGPQISFKRQDSDVYPDGEVSHPTARAARNSILSLIPLALLPASSSSLRTPTQIRESALVCKISGTSARESMLFQEEAWFLNFRTRVGRLVREAWFESFFGIIIVVNALSMGAERQYVGIQMGFELGMLGSNRSSEETWPGAEHVFSGIDWAIGILFTLEVLLKFIGNDFRKFAKDPWNSLDVVIVLCWLVEKLGSDTLPIDTQLLRLLRLARLLRLLRLVRSLEGFDSLYLMTQAVKGSLSILGWACVLLFLIQVALALLVSQLLSDSYMLDETKPIAERQMVFVYFGTFTRSLLSMFEVTLANWPPICRLLSENVTEWFMFFCVLHKLTVGFAVIGVINGVFMQETFKAASADDVIMMRQKKKAEQVHIDKMQALFTQADHNCDGTLDMQEFREVLNDAFIKTWLGSMGLEVDDADSLFELIDHQTHGKLSADQLIKGVARLKGTARALDLAKDMRHSSDILDRLEHYLNTKDAAILPHTALTSPRRSGRGIVVRTSVTPRTSLVKHHHEALPEPDSLRIEL